MSNNVSHSRMTDEYYVRATGRAWSKIRVNRSTGCWEWTARKNACGYGTMKVLGNTVLAHRLVYSLGSDIPDGKSLDHLCRVRHCVNPQHLEPVTHAENMRRGDMSVNGRRMLSKTHCPAGHEYSEENTYIYEKTGGRHCRACHRAAERARRARGK